MLLCLLRDEGSAQVQRFAEHWCATSAWVTGSGRRLCLPSSVFPPCLCSPLILLLQGLLVFIPVTKVPAGGMSKEPFPTIIMNDGHMVNVLPCDSFLQSSHTCLYSLEIGPFNDSHKAHILHGNALSIPHLLWAWFLGLWILLVLIMMDSVQLWSDPNMSTSGSFLPTPWLCWCPLLATQCPV